MMHTATPIQESASLFTTTTSSESATALALAWGYDEQSDQSHGYFDLFGSSSMNAQEHRSAIASILFEDRS